MARVFVYSTIDLKPGADPKDLEDLCRQVNTLFQKVPGCMDAVVGVALKRKQTRNTIWMFSEWGNMLLALPGRAGKLWTHGLMTQKN